MTRGMRRIQDCPLRGRTEELWEGWDYPPLCGRTEGPWEGWDDPPLCGRTEGLWESWEDPSLCGRTEGLWEGWEDPPLLHSFRCCSICSRSLNFWIFPEMVRG